MIGNLNLRNRILIARAIFEILVTVLTERIYSSTLQVLDRLKDIPTEGKPFLKESHRLLGIGKITQTLECYFIAKYKEFLRNNEQVFYQRRRLEDQIDALIEQSLNLLNTGKASRQSQLSGAGIDSKI